MNSQALLMTITVICLMIGLGSIAAGNMSGFIALLGASPGVYTLSLDLLPRREVIR